MPVSRSIHLRTSEGIPAITRLFIYLFRRQSVTDPELRIDNREIERDKFVPDDWWVLYED